MSESSTAEAMLVSMGEMVSVAGDAVASIFSATPEIVSVAWSKKTCRCGDVVQVNVTLSSEGFDGTLVIGVLDHMRGVKIGNFTIPVKGGVTFRQAVTSIKLVDVWGGAFDFLAAVELRDAQWNVVAEKSAAELLTVVRPANALSPQNISGGWRTCPKWEYDKKTALWAKGQEHYGWPCNYQLEFKDGEIIVTCKVKLTARAPFVLTDAHKARWRAEIEGYWAGAYEVHRVLCKWGLQCGCTYHCCRHPIVIQCEFVDQGEHCEVEVIGGACDKEWGDTDWWCSSVWWEDWSDNVPKAVRAHEFGHLLGLYDEYLGGAMSPSVDPNTVTFDDRSVMSSGAAPMKNHGGTLIVSINTLLKDKFYLRWLRPL
ncbi:MAG: hypothetical protein JNK72_04780 [Myxococcales bacterium]|nr:hypothetical protein [Myxococcales bacterium]